VRTTAQATFARMHPARRQRLMVELLRAAVASGRPDEVIALHRAIAAQQLSWPAIAAEPEAHGAGLYVAVADTAGVPGAIVECGVGHGASIVALARANQIFSPTRSVVGFDSFRGFPDADRQDLGSRVRAVGPVTGWDDTSVEAVSDALDAPAELVAGFFSDTLPRSLPDRISLLHVDCDLYRSTRDVLDHALPRMSPGALVILDEYDEAAWPGATTAVDEAFAATPHRPEWDPLLHRHVVRIPSG
jgi:predicted O-methyltransferase YrrM